MNYLITLSFLGHKYHGWQMQSPEFPTVESNVLQCLQKLWSDVDFVQGCSRTDAGVNASGYMANFKTCFNLPSDKVPVALNSVLPPDIRCLDCVSVDESFNARFDSKGKLYSYSIDTSPIQSPLNSLVSWHCPSRLNLEDMQKTAQLLLGERDFSSFCNSGDKCEHKIRKIHDISIEEEQNRIKISIHGNAFLYNMCRIIAGFIVHYGKYGYDNDEIIKIIDGRDRKANLAATLPPHGLWLEKVFYE